MTDLSAPDQTQRVIVDGPEAVLVPSGGRGMPCRYGVEPHRRPVDACYRVVGYDQPGTRAPDRPNDDGVASSTTPPICNSPRAAAS